jgi:hypothetical protein
LKNRDVRERPRAGDVAGGPPAVGGTQEIVHGHERLGVVDARGAHAQSLQVSAPPGGNQQVLAVNRPRAAKVHRKIAAVVADPPQSRPDQDVDAFPAEYLADQLAGLRLFGRQQPVRGLDDRDRGSNLANAWASSTPTAPPPATVSEADASLASRAS